MKDESLHTYGNNNIINPFDPTVPCTLEELVAAGFKDPYVVQELHSIIKDILQGDPSAKKTEEFKYLNFAQIETFLRWLYQMNDPNLNSLILSNPWMLVYKDKPPTPEEFLSHKYIGSMADSIYEPIRKAFIEFFDPLKSQRTLILNSSIGSGKAQPYSSLVATGVEFEFDDGTILEFEPNELVYDGTKFIKALEVETDLPQPLCYFMHMIYDLKKHNLCTEAFDINDYSTLVNWFKLHPAPDGVYTQTHHIIPRYAGGTDEPDNLVDLPYYFHIKAHYLLAMENMQKNNKREAFQNFKAVSFCLGYPHIPTDYKGLIKELDFVIQSLEEKFALERQTVWMRKDGEKSKKVFAEEIAAEEAKGWSRGRQFRSPKSKRWVYKDGKNYYIEETEVNEYLNKGYKLGMHQTEKMIASGCKKCSRSTLGTKWMHKGTERKAVKKEEIDKYLSEGWKLGSGMTPAGKKIPGQQMLWYTNGVETRQCYTKPEGWQLCKKD